MAAGDAVIVRGTYATVQASASVANGAMSGGAVTAIGAALAATEEDYPLLDFRISMTVGTPTTPGTIDIYRRPSDGTNQAQAPTAAYKQQYVGSVQLSTSAATQYYYLYGVANVDQGDTFYGYNASGATLTFVIAARGRSLNTA